MSHNCPHCKQDLTQNLEDMNLVPRGRIAELTREVEAAKKEATEAKKTAGVSAELAKELATTKAAAATAQATYDQDVAFLERGLTKKSVREVAAMHFARQAEAGEKDPGVWLDGLKADVSKAPDVLAPFLQVPAAPASSSTAPATKPAGKPGPTDSTKTVPSHTQVFDAKAIDAMTVSEFRENYGAIAAANPSLKLPTQFPFGSVGKPPEKAADSSAPAKS